MATLRRENWLYIVLPRELATFLHENWRYIVLPVALVILALAALCIFGGSDASPIIYPIF
jgi:hypothetical protein